MKHRLMILTGFAMLTGLATASSFAEEKAAWRLFVSDHADPVIHAIDAGSGKVIDTFNVTQPASLYRTASGRTVFAVQGKGDVVSVLASGISFDDHGDHGDIDIQPPRLLDLEIGGKKPSHFVEHDGDIALFFDGEG